MTIIINTTAAAARSFVTTKVTLDFDPELYAKANRLGADALADPRGPEAYLRDIFSTNDAVFAIYPDPKTPGVFTSEVIHGAGTMARVFSGAELDLRVTAWHCSSAEDARRIRAAFSRDSHYDRERLRKVQTPNHHLTISRSPDILPVPKEIRDLTPEANTNLERLKLHQAQGGETLEWYRDLFESHDRVVLIFFDRELRTQLGCIVAKDRSLDGVEVDASGEPARRTAMITASRAQAISLCETFGNAPQVRS